jgi:hypothetical protein
MCEWPEEAFRDENDEKRTKEFLKEIQIGLNLLPKWAKVAFAARCARRMLPIYNKNWANVMLENKLLERVRNVENFISVTEISAAKAFYAFDVPQIEWTSYVNPLLFEAMPAFCAMDAAYIAGGNVSIYRTSLDETVLAVIRSCSWDAIYLSDSDKKHIRDAICNDVKVIVKESAINCWTDETPVAQKIFGEMWPNGKPGDWE